MSRERWYRHLPMTWHAILAATETDDDGDDFYLPAAAARQSFELVFDSISETVPRDGQIVGEMQRRAPHGSPQWAALRRLLSMFRPYEYVDAARWLSADVGPRTLIQVNISQTMHYGDGKDDERRLRFRAMTAVAPRLLQAAARELDALAADRELAEVYVHTSDVVAWIRITSPPSECVPLFEYLLSAEENEALGMWLY